MSTDAKFTAIACALVSNPYNNWEAVQAAKASLIEAGKIWVCCDPRPEEITPPAAEDHQCK